MTRGFKVAALLCVSGNLWAAPAPSSEDMARCAAIPAPELRLHCYDQLAQRPADRTPIAAARTPAAPAVAPTSAPPPVADAASFGLSPVQRHVEVVGPKSQDAQVVDMYTDQNNHSVLKLDNGQSWSVLDDDGRLSNGDKVTIKRASLGSYMLWTKQNHSYRVKRLQ